MGIMAGYTGADGGTRTFDLEGAPSPGTVAAGLLGAQPLHAPQLTLGGAPLTMPLPQMPEMPPLPSMADDADRGKVKVTDGDMPDVLARKLMPNGSIVAVGNALCLKGEEGGTPGGTRIYGVHGGASGFGTLAQFDPGAGGVPLAGAGDAADGGSWSANGTDGLSLRVGGRTEVKIEFDPSGTQWLVVTDYYRMADFSPNGRIVRVSKEIERLVLKTTFAGGKGEGKYGVKPFFADGGDDAVHPIPDAFAFGTEENLDTWNEDTGRFECNYNDGELVEDPPVKVVVTIPNTGGGVQ